MDRRLHEPGRDRDPRAARRGPPRGRPVQRGDRVPALFAGLLGVEPERIVVDQVGLNHLTWVRAVRLDGQDVLPMLLAAHGDALAVAGRAAAPTARRARRGALLLPALLLRARPGADEQRDGIPRATTVAEIEHELLELYRDPALTEKPALLERRGGAFYSEAAIGLVASLSSGGGAVHVVDVRNERDARRARARRRRRGARRRRPERPRAAAPGPAGARAARARPARRRLRAARRRGRAHRRSRRRPQGAAHPPADRPVRARGRAARAPSPSGRAPAALRGGAPRERARGPGRRRRQLEDGPRARPHRRQPALARARPGKLAAPPRARGRAHGARGAARRGGARARRCRSRPPSC